AAEVAVARTLQSVLSVVDRLVGVAGADIGLDCQNPGPSGAVELLVEVGNPTQVVECPLPVLRGGVPSRKAPGGGDAVLLRGGGLAHEPEQVGPRRLGEAAPELGGQVVSRRGLARRRQQRAAAEGAASGAKPAL